MAMCFAAALCVVCSQPYPASAQQIAVQTAPAQKPAIPESVSYTVEARLVGDGSAILAAMRANSVLIEHQKRGAPDFASLIVRSRTDQKRLLAALYGEARYGGSVSITIDGVELDTVGLSERARNAKQPVPVRIIIKPGPEFRFGQVTIDETRPTDATVPKDPDDYGLVSGNTARSKILVAAFDKIVHRWRAAGFPFAQIHDKTVTADHARQRLDVRVTVDPGNSAVYGWINIVGPKKLRNRVVADQSALDSGTRYNPADLVRTRERLRKLDSVQSVRIVEGRQLDGTGGIPITLEVTERKPRYVGVTASVTTLDGAEARTHWGHRNLFGGSEHLRIEGAVSQIGVAPFDKLEFDAAATLTKPGILDIDTDLFTEFRVTREANDVFLSDTAIAKAGLKRRYSPHLSASLALEGRYIREDTDPGDNEFAVLSLPGTVAYDTRNNRFDPTSGIHAKASLAPVTDLNDANSFFTGEFDVANYWALDAQDRAVLALRVHGGSIFGSSLGDIPSTYRFLAGGGNSVRGYEYRSIGATSSGQVVSGLSYASSSVELRLRPMMQIGIVPFVDVATVSLDRVPKFSDSVYVGAGIGFRYYTAIGPIRLDAALPLTNRENRSKFGLYVGLGQAF